MVPVDWAVVAILAVAAISGLKQGFFRSVCGLGGLILGLAVASWNFHHAADALSSFIQARPVAEMVAFLAIAVVVIIVAGFVGHVFAKTLKLIGLGWLDTLAGGIFGLIQGAAFVSILMLAAAAFFPGDAYWIAEGKVTRNFIGTASLGSHITPPDLGKRIRAELHDWQAQAQQWLHEVGK